MKKNVVAIIMAGGLGKRMESDIPKVLHKIDDVPMIVRILKNLRRFSCMINLEKIIIVVGKYKEQIQKVINEHITQLNIVYVMQEPALGTGHAVMCCRYELEKSPESDVLILSGDVPLLTIETMQNLINMEYDVKLISTTLVNPHGYGRIILENNEFIKIMEEKDATEEEKSITQVNGGIYCIKSALLCNNFKYLHNDNNQDEYYLTDMIEIIKDKEDKKVGIFNSDPIEIMGINTKEQLKELEEYIQHKNKNEIKNYYNI